MKSTKNRNREILSNYLPKGAVDYVLEILRIYPTQFKIVAPRKTKRGDFRWNPITQQHQVSINGDLFPFSFLITTLHEFAHLISFQKFGTKIQPHGKEWKNEFKELLLPMIEKEIFPLEIKSALLSSIHSMKASSCNDIDLLRALRKQETPHNNEIVLEEIPENSTFVLNGRRFRRKNLRRTRFLCEEVTTGKEYLINRLAQVSLEK